jgi:hypothetical protein
MRAGLSAELKRPIDSGLNENTGYFRADALGIA